MKKLILTILLLLVTASAFAEITIRKNYFGDTIIRDNNSGESVTCSKNVFGEVVCR